VDLLFAATQREDESPPAALSPAVLDLLATDRLR
jgi:hypothetical protein